MKCAASTFNRVAFNLELGMILANQTVQVRMAPAIADNELAPIPVFVKLAESKRVVLCFHQRYKSSMIVPSPRSMFRLRRFAYRVIVDYSCDVNP